MKTYSRTKNSVLNVITGIGGQLLIVLLKFITRTVFIYTLGKAYLGINGLFTDILTMLSLTELGFDTAINYKMYKPLAEKDEKRLRVLMKFYRQVYTAIGLVIILIGLCLIPLLRYIISDYDSLDALGINAPLIFLLYLAQSASTYLFFAYKSAIIKADQKGYILNVAGYAVTIAANLAQILVLYILHDFVIYTAVLVAFNIIQNLVFAAIAQHYYPNVFKKEKDKLERHEKIGLFKDCGVLFLHKVNGVVLKASDNIVLSMFIGLSIVGMYSNYLMFYTMVKSVLGKIYDAVKASMGNLYTVADMAKRYAFFKVMNYVTMLMYGTVAVVVAVVADEFIQQWVGADFVIAQPFAILMGIEILLVGLKNNLLQVRNVTGAFRQYWFRPLLGIIINIAVSVSLVNVCGIYGVLIGTIASDILSFFIFDPGVIHKYSFNNYRPVSEYYVKNIGYILLLAGVTALDILLCQVILPGQGWISVILHATITGVSVPLFLALVYIKTPEFKYLFGIVKSIKKKTLSK